MKKFWIDFSGYLCVEAENEAEAEEKFWELIHNRMDLTSPFSDDVWDIDTIEERDEPSAFITPSSTTAQDWDDFWNSQE